jgi:uncharacterized membrane protein
LPAPQRNPAGDGTRDHASLAFLALLVGNLALAAGPFLVRNAGVGPTAAGFWRLALAIPFLIVIARMGGAPLRVPRRAALIGIVLAAFFFATDLAALAGLLYTGYLILVERVRGEVAPLPLLVLASAFGAVMLLPLAVGLGERLVPADWTALLALALCSQVVGQGLLVYALGHVPPLVVGIAMLTQPALSAFLGWRFYGETLTLLDWLGAALIVAALVLVRLRARPAGATLSP